MILWLEKPALQIGKYIQGQSSGSVLSCLFCPFSLQQFLLQLPLLLFVDAVLDLLFELLLLAPNLLQLGFPLCLQVWILEHEQHLA